MSGCGPISIARGAPTFKFTTGDVAPSWTCTTATLLLDSGVAIEEVQDLLDHEHITTTPIHDTRRRIVRDSAA